MANVDLEIGGRRYSVACRAGEEAKLQEVGALVESKAQAAADALGSLSETRQLLFASLLLGDELRERRAAAAADDGRADAASETGGADDSAAADALERLAARVESLAERLEGGAGNP